MTITQEERVHVLGENDRCCSLRNQLVKIHDFNARIDRKSIIFLIKAQGARKN